MQTNIAPTGTELRRKAIKDIENCVCRDRQNTYKDAEDNFEATARVLNVVLGDKLATKLTSVDVALIMCSLKLVRASVNPGHRDNLIDLGGYAVCGVGIVDRESARAADPTRVDSIPASHFDDPMMPKSATEMQAMKLGLGK